MLQNLILTKDFENSECMQQDWHLKVYLPITETLTTKKQLVNASIKYPNFLSSGSQ